MVSLHYNVWTAFSDLFRMDCWVLLRGASDPGCGGDATPCYSGYSFRVRLSRVVPSGRGRFSLGYLLGPVDLSAGPPLASQERIQLSAGHTCQYNAWKGVQNMLPPDTLVYQIILSRALEKLHMQEGLPNLLPST